MAKLKRTVIVGGLSGTSGPVTFKLTREGTIVSERSHPTNPNTPSQESARSRFTTSARRFRQFTPAQEESWRLYAQSVAKADTVSGGTRGLSALNAYLRLATKFLQVNPNGTPPTAPPTSSYDGDANLSFTAVAGAGKVTFTSSGPNSPLTRTELLLQPLASPLRNPAPKGYRSRAFASFTGASGSSVDVAVTPGFYAAAYRFVNTATGQATELRPLAVVQVALAIKKAA